MLFAVFVSLITPGPAQIPAETVVHKMQAGGRARNYRLRIPVSAQRKRSAPLVILLHGWTATAAVTESYTEFGAKADREGFVLAIPDGLGNPKGWNVGFLDLSGQRADDAQFVADLAAEVAGKVRIDPKRIYVAGHSNGAMLAHLVGARFSDRFAAIGAVAGTIGVPNRDGGQTRIPAATRPISAILIHAEDDETVAFAPGRPALLKCIGAEESARWWASQIRARAEPRKQVVVEDRVTRFRWERGRDRTEVELVRLKAGGHAWPGAQAIGGRETASGVAATDLLWEFFRRHPKR